MANTKKSVTIPAGFTETDLAVFQPTGVPAEHPRRNTQTQNQLNKTEQRSTG
jgi:hypothetical protein